MSNRRNYYRILHVQPDAPDSVIRSSYRAVMQKQKFHPDLGGDHVGAVLINEAFAVLTDPVKRAAYDRELMLSHSKPSLGGDRVHHGGGHAPERTVNEPRPPVRDNIKKQNISRYCAFCKMSHAEQSQHDPDATCTNCESPLFLAAPIQLDNNSRRAVQRFSKNEHLKFYTEWPQLHKLGQLQDLSLNGMSFTTSEPVAKKQIIKLACCLMHAIAEVISCQSTGELGANEYSVGLRFLTLRFENKKGNFMFVQA